MLRLLLLLSALWAAVTSPAGADDAQLLPHFERPIRLQDGSVVDVSFLGFLELQTREPGRLRAIGRELARRPFDLPHWVLFSVAAERWREDASAALRLYSLGQLRARYATMRCRRDLPGDLFNPLSNIERDLYGDLYRHVEQASPAGRAEALRWALSERRKFADDASAAEMCGWVFGERDFRDRRRLEREFVRPRSEWPAIGDRVTQGFQRLIEIEEADRVDPFPSADVTTSVVEMRPAEEPMWLDDDTLALGFDRAEASDPLALAVHVGGETRRFAALGGEPGRHVELACAAHGQIGRREQRIVPGRVEANALALLSMQSGDVVRQDVLTPYVLSVMKPFSWQDGEADWINPYTCEVVDHVAFMARLDAVAPAERYRRNVYPLRPGDGYVVSVRDERLISHNRLVLADVALGSAVDLGLQLEWERLVWSPRDAAYFIPVESHGSLFIDDAVSIALIDPVRRTLRSIEIERSAINEADVVYWPSAEGVLALVNWYQTPRGTLPGALYLLKENGPVRIYEARAPGSSLRMRSTSPNGCRAVLSEFSTRNLDHAVVIVDLCTQESRLRIAEAAAQRAGGRRR